MSLPTSWFAAGGVLILPGAAAYWIASQLPATRSATASVAIESPANDIMAVLGDVASQPAWRPDVLAVEVRSVDEWTEQRRGGESITFRAVARSERTLELAFKSTRGDHGRWRGQLSADRDGVSTLVKVEESATVPAPFQRLMARLRFDPEKFAADDLARLKSEAGRRSRAAWPPQGEVGRATPATARDATAAPRWGRAGASRWSPFDGRADAVPHGASPSG